MFTCNKYLTIINEDIENSLEDLFYYFSENSAELYLVGGCVRDMLLNRSPKDYDLCTNLTPQEIKDLLLVKNDEYPTINRYLFIDTGIKHGTITVIDNFCGTQFEITTYRKDVGYSDHRHPDEVVFTPSLEEDLKRRDFTINSFAYDLNNSLLLMLDESYLKDLKYGIIRTVGDPAERYEEDALRMLRAIRFSAQLNFSIEKYTYYAIKMCAHLLKNVSKERIRDELSKILLSNHPEMLELICTTELETYIFGINDRYPEIDIDYSKGITPFTDILKCKHENKFHYADVFHHTMDVVKKVPNKFELKWAALLHDVGKPQCKKEKEDEPGYFRYLGHPEVSVEIADKVMTILKFSNSQKNLILKYVKYHDSDLVNYRNSKFKNVLVDIGIDNFLDFMELRKADSFAHCLLIETKYAIDYIDALYARFDKIKVDNNALTLKDLKLNGNYIMKDNYFKGKEIGDCLNWLLEQVLENPEFNTKEKLIELYNLYKEMCTQSI